MSRINTLDIDDLNTRLRELLDARDEFATGNVGDGDDQYPSEEAARQAWSDQNPDDAAELARLEALRDEIGSKGDLIDDQHGPFVDEGDFAAYAEELADDLGLIRNTNDWPMRCIDWDKAADELRADYYSVEWDGTTYLYRA